MECNHILMDTFLGIENGNPEFEGFVAKTIPVSDIRYEVVFHAEDYYAMDIYPFSYKKYGNIIRVLKKETGLSLIGYYCIPFHESPYFKLFLYESF